MGDLARLLRLRKLEEKLAEEQLIRARVSLGRLEGLDQATAEGRRLAEAGRLAELSFGNVEASIWHDQTARQLETSNRAVGARLAAERAEVAALSVDHAAAHRERRRLEVLVEVDRRGHRYRQQVREQRQLDDAYLAARRATGRVSADPERPSSSLKHPHTGKE